MDDYGRHEVLHMAQFLSRAVEHELGEHAQVQANPAWKALADTAGQALWDLYQAVGASTWPMRKQAQRDHDEEAAQQSGTRHLGSYRK